MEESKPLNKSEIDNEKQKLQQEVKRLDIYKNCYMYALDRFLRYFPNKATEIEECFREEEGKNVLQPDKKEQLQNIIMEELCSWFEHYIHKGFKVLQLDNNYHRYSQNNVICLNKPENYKNIGISLGSRSKIVSTNAYFRNENDNGQLKPRFVPISGIQINYNYKDNKFHNEINIFDFDMDYTLIINPDAKDIKLTDFDAEIPYTTFCDQSNEIFKDKDEIIHFFSTLSFTEIEQVLQILNKHLEGKNYDEVDIKTVLKEIKDTIEENRKEEKKNEENSIGNNLNNSNNLIPNNSNNNLSLSDNDLNKDLNQKNTFVNVNDINNDKGNKVNTFEEGNENNKSETKKNDNVFNNEPNKSNIFYNEQSIKKNNENTETVLNIDEKRNDKKKNEENSIIKNELINEKSNTNIELVFNKTKDKIDKKIDTKQKPKIEKDDGICCKCCITCLKQCWSHNEREK